MGSIKILNFFPQTSQFPTNNNSIHPPISHKPSQLPFHHPPKLPISTKLSLSHIPTSKGTNKCISFTKLVAEKVLISLIGAFILMGSFNFRTRPSLALSPQPGKTQMEKTEYEEEELYEQLLDKDPRNLKALKMTVYGKMRKGKTKEAVKYIEKLKDFEPDEVEWRLLEAHCYETMGQFSKAKRLFKEILEERPLELRALHGLAMVMHKNLEGVAVFEMLDKALEIACCEKRVTEERNVRILIAQMKVVKGELEEGLKELKALVEENPRDFRPYLCQGIIYSLMDRKEEAAEQFEIYQSLVPDEFPQRGFLDDVVLSAKTTQSWQQQHHQKKKTP